MPTKTDSTELTRPQAISLPVSMWDELRARRERTGVAISQQIRRYVAAGLARPE